MVDFVHVVPQGLDLSPYFLAVAKYKEKKSPKGSNSFQWIHANGEDTGLDSQSFDIVSIAYVVRLLWYYLLCLKDGTMHIEIQKELIAPSRGGVYTIT